MYNKANLQKTQTIAKKKDGSTYKTTVYRKIDNGEGVKKPRGLINDISSEVSSDRKNHSDFIAKVRTYSDKVSPVYVALSSGRIASEILNEAFGEDGAPADVWLFMDDAGETKRKMYHPDDDVFDEVEEMTYIEENEDGSATAFFDRETLGFIADGMGDVVGEYEKWKKRRSTKHCPMYLDSYVNAKHRQNYETGARMFQALSYKSDIVDNWDKMSITQAGTIQLSNDGMHVDVSIKPDFSGDNDFAWISYIDKNGHPQEEKCSGNDWDIERTIFSISERNKGSKKPGEHAEEFSQRALQLLEESGYGNCQMRSDGSIIISDEGSDCIIYPQASSIPLGGDKNSSAVIYCGNVSNISTYASSPEDVAQAISSAQQGDEILSNFRMTPGDRERIERK